jgi:hypothetical protein
LKQCITDGIGKLSLGTRSINKAKYLGEFSVKSVEKEWVIQKTVLRQLANHLEKQLGLIFVSCLTFKQIPDELQILI